MKNRSHRMVFRHTIYHCFSCFFGAKSHFLWRNCGSKIKNCLEHNGLDEVDFAHFRFLAFLKIRNEFNRS